MCNMWYIIGVVIFLIIGYSCVFVYDLKEEDDVGWIILPVLLAAMWPLAGLIGFCLGAGYLIGKLIKLIIK